MNFFLSKRRPPPGRSFVSWHEGVVHFLPARLYPACLIIGVYAVLALVLVISDSSILQAQMYLCRDESGSTNFTNVANGSDCTAIELKKKINLAKFPSRSYSSDSSNPARFDREIRRIGRLYNVDPPLIKAIIHAESYFDHAAVSRCGAQGLMQLMPDTAMELQVANPFNPLENIDGGTRYFRSLLDNYNEDLILSLAAYNAGPGLVTRTGGVPRIPETLHYINKVLKMYKVYKASW